jgi:serine/threonine-protein kinase
MLFAHLQNPIPDPRALVPELPREIAQAVRKALAKNPEDRFQTAGELAAAFQQAVPVGMEAKAA